MKCENCNKDHGGSYGSGRFCSVKCARGFATKDKREEINKKVSNALTKEKIVKFCKECGKEFPPPFNRKRIIFCSNKCSVKHRNKDSEYILKLSEAQKKRCESVDERKRLRDIGRKGGFGKKGYTKKGVRFESSLEEICFNYLDSKYIVYTPHKQIPNSSKVSDIFLEQYNIWIEIDGIDRERKKEWLQVNYLYWLEKLEIYKQNNLSLIICKSYDEFKEEINKLL